METLRKRSPDAPGSAGSADRGAGGGTGAGTVRLVVGMVLLVLVGSPLVYFLWGAVNSLLLGEPESVRYRLVIPAGAAFAVLLAVVSRLVRRWGNRPESTPAVRPGGTVADGRDAP